MVLWISIITEKYSNIIRLLNVFILTHHSLVGLTRDGSRTQSTRSDEWMSNGALR